MRNKLKSRKGATLAELVIVLAVVVIAAGMVVSFSSMMHGAQGISNARHEALQDVRVAEALIESFIENNANENLQISDDGERLFFNKTVDGEEKEFYVFLSYSGAFVMSGNEVLFLESLESIEFSSTLYGDFKIKVKEVDGVYDLDPDGQEISFDTISLPFPEEIPYEFADVVKIEEVTDILYYCTITYNVADTPYTYTFCVNPYAGEGGT